MALSAPQQNGDQLNQVDVKDHTLLVSPTEFIPHIPTVHTKPGEQSPAIRCNVVDLEGGLNVKYTGVLWFGVISSSLKRQIGETILGRMSQGQASPGKNAPWQLADIMAETAWVDYANSWLASPEGQQWEVDNINEVNRAAAAAQLAGAAAPTQQTAPAAAQQGPPPAWATAPPTTPPASPTPRPAGPPSSAPAAAVPAGPPSAPAAVALPAGLEALIAALPADQQAAARAVMAAQQGAAS